MVFGLVGLVFNVFTYPGLLVNGLVQSVFNELCGVPSGRVAVDKDIDLDGVQRTEDMIAKGARVLEPGEKGSGGERVKQFIDYRAVEAYPKLLMAVLGPFVAMTALALGLFGGFVSLGLFGLISGESDFIWWVGFYPGFVIAAHAFPNREAADALYDRSIETDSLLRLVGYPMAALSTLFNILEFLWIDAIYAYVLYWLLAARVGVFV